MAKFKLKDLSLSKLEYGSGAAACAFDGHVRYVRITDITDDGSLASDIVSPSYYEEKHVLQEGDILFARTGATVGKTFLYRNKYGKCVYAGFLIRMVPDRSIVLPDYIYYFTKSPRYRDFVAANMKVVAQPNINAKQYGDLEIDVPSFKEQQSIVDKLVKIDELIALRKEQLAKLDQLDKSRFIELFGDPETNPKGLEKVLLSDIAEYFNGLTYSPDNVTNDGTVVLRSSNIQNSQLDFADTVRVNSSIKDKLFVKDNDILMCSRNGSARLVGKVALIKNLSEPMTFGAFMMIIRSRYYPYLMTYFQMDAFRRQIATGATTTINQITGNMLNKISLPLPDMADINGFTAFVEQTDKSKLAIQQSLDKLELLKKSLMQEYFG